MILLCQVLLTLVLKKSEIYVIRKVKMIDKKSVIIGTFAGMLIGIITSVFLASIIIYSIGESFQVENMNITIALNQTQLEKVIRDSPGYQTAGAGAVQISALQSNISQNSLCDFLVRKNRMIKYFSIF